MSECADLLLPVKRPHTLSISSNTLSQSIYQYSVYMLNLFILCQHFANTCFFSSHALYPSFTNRCSGGSGCLSTCDQIFRSCTPTSQPTSRPTLQPLSRPTLRPSRQPWGKPSSRPSRRPTMRPSRQVSH